MKKDTSKYALSSAQARRNSLNSPWRRQAHCATKRAREMRAKLDDKARGGD